MINVLNLECNCLLSSVIPVQAEIQTYRYRNLSGKRFPKFDVLNSRLCGNDGGR